MTAFAPPAVRRPSCNRLLSGCALGALLAAIPGVVAAQALQGTGTPVAGSATITVAPSFTQIEIASPEVVIDWAPFDNAGTGTIDFLPVGATAVFAEPTGTFDYTVLNRVIPMDALGLPADRAIAFNGTVTSQIGNFPGGNIWFYSPTGIILGPTAVFKVGSLVLTTDDVVFGATNTGGSELFGPGGEIQFRGPADSTPFVDIQAGAQVDATGGPFGAAYLALVAPRVTQAGAVSVDGPIAYVAAEQADISINAGLFDIAILAGTTDPNGIVHTGVTGGAASTGAADTQRISMVALPKNTALTMLLSGSIGYDPAVSAFDDGSSIVLTAGYDNGDPIALPANTLSNIAMGGGLFGNALTAYASNDITASLNGGSIAFSGETLLHGLNAVTIEATNGAFITAAGNLNVGAGSDGAGGTIALSAIDGGEIAVASSLFLDASSSSVPYLPSLALAAQGGSVTVLADNGSITAINSFSANAGAFGGSDIANGGDGVAGSIDVSVINGGLLQGDFVDLSAQGIGGFSEGQGGNGTGGTVSLADLGGTLDFNLVFLDAAGRGGATDAGTGGNGLAGQASLQISGAAQAWDFVSITGDAQAGFPDISGGLTGNATSGANAARLLIEGPGALNLSSGASVSARALMSVDGVAGFVGQGGEAVIEVRNGGDLIVAGILEANASATLEADFPPFESPNSPTQRGGTVSILADTGGTISALNLLALAEAESYSATANAGTATGGSALVAARNGGAISLTGAAPIQSSISANGYGSAGAIASDAFGGTARLVAEDGSVTASHQVAVSADGAVREYDSPAPSGDGFDAAGGTALVEILAGASGTGTIDALQLAVRANGDARLFIVGTASPASGEPIQGDGGQGQGGTASASVAAGNLTADALLVESAGIGGASAPSATATAFQSGNGTGGTSLLTTTGGTTTAPILEILANGTGGGGTGSAGGGPDTAALAGSGSGGAATLSLAGGALTATSSVQIAASGTGAGGMDHSTGGLASNGGDGTGGNALIQSVASSTANFTTPSLTLTADGIGGNGGVSTGGTDGNGGTGVATLAAAQFADGRFTLGTAALQANGLGGDGLTGGVGSGGQATFSVIDTVGATGPRTLQGLTVEANGEGGLSGGGTPVQGDAGSAALVAQVQGASSGISVSGDVALASLGTVASATSGVSANLSGAGFAIAGNVAVDATGDIAIAAAQPLSAAGNADFTAGRTFTSTGLVSAGADLAVQAPLGIDAERLASGGTTSLSATLGALVVSSDLAAAGNVTALARSIDIASAGALAFADLDATAGPLSVVTAGDLDLATANATGAVTLRSTGGALTATGSVMAGGSVVAEGLGGVTLPVLVSGGTTQLAAANGLVDIGTLVSPGAVSVAANSVDIAGSGALTFTTAQATTDMTVTASGNLAFGSAVAGGGLSLTSSTGSLTATGDIDGGSTLLDAAGDIAIGGDLTGAPLTATAGGTFTVAGNAVTGDATIVAPGGITLASLSSGTSTRLEAVNGTIVVSDLTTFGSVQAFGLDVALASNGPLFIAQGSATAGDFEAVAAGELTTGTVDASGIAVLTSTGDYIRAAGNVNAGEIRMTAANDVRAEGNLSATGALAIDAGASFVLDGIARGSTVSVLSADIDLRGTSQLGERGVTSTLTLTNRDPALLTQVGDSASTASAWTLDGSEMVRLFADEAITIGVDLPAPSTAGLGDIAIGDFALTYGTTGHIGTGGLLEISTPATVSITGDVALTTGNADDTFRIDPTLIELDTTTGSIAMLDSAGDPLGRLDMIGGTVAIASTATLGQLRTTTDFGAITDLLDQPGGSAAALSAGAIRFEVDTGLYIQNAGTSDEFADRRGFEAGAVDIVTAAPSSRIAINGLILTPGGPVGGLDTEALITINGAAAAAGGPFDPASTINGCVIGADCAFVPPSGPNLPDLDAPTREDLESPLPSGTEPGLFGAPLIELVETTPLITPPLVDEPITGVGNDDLWQPRCDAEDEEDCGEADGDRE